MSRYENKQIVRNAATVGQTPLLVLLGENRTLDKEIETVQECEVRF